MNYTNIIRHIVPTRKALTDWPRLLIGLFIVMVIALFSYMVYLTLTSTDTIPLAEVGSTSASANPELSLYFQYSNAVLRDREASFLANNPEVGLFQRYQAIKAASALRNSLAINPELMITNRYVAGTELLFAEADYLAGSPEIMAYQRYAVEVVDQAEADFLARNPEIIAYRRYVDDQ